MKHKELKEIRKILEACWSPETSFYIGEEYEDRAREGVTSFGQCYVTAKALQEILEWSIVKNRNVKHYWNKLPNGTEVDFTSDQFGGDGINPVMDVHSGKEQFSECMGTPKKPDNASKRYRDLLDCVRGPLISRKSRREVP